MKVTMKEIAEQCGVCKAVVSRVLSEDPTLRITPETRQRVLSVVERLGYSRNVNAQALASNKNARETAVLRIGYITFTSRKHSGHPYFSHVADGIEEEAARNHMQVLIRMETQEFRQSLGMLLETYQDHPLDGIILLGKIQEESACHTIRRIARHVISMSGQFDKTSDYVGTDTLQSILLAMEHLRQLQYTEFGVLHGSTSEQAAVCCRWLQEHGLTLKPGWYVDGEYAVDVAYERTLEALQSGRPPRAIVSCNDEMAIGCIRALREKGWRVPEDVAVTGHDDISLAAYVDVPLTTVRIYKREMGRLAVKILLDRIESKRKNPVLLEIPGKLIKRDSCGWKLKKK